VSSGSAGGTTLGGDADRAATERAGAAPRRPPAHLDLRGGPAETAWRAVAAPTAPRARRRRRRPIRTRRPCSGTHDGPDPHDAGDVLGTGSRTARDGGEIRWTRRPRSAMRASAACAAPGLVGALPRERGLRRPKCPYAAVFW
jgi:hypothetical protein